MVSLNTPVDARKKLAEYARIKRLQLELTQAGLAKRSGVALPTLRKFERTGLISLESYLKLQLVLGGLDDLLAVSMPKPQTFRLFDDVLDETPTAIRQRGSRT